MRVLADRTYRVLFSAQVIALLGTGLATVALGLLAYRLAGASAGVVLGTVLAIKMAANVLVAPVVTALADRLPRRAFLVGLDLVRAAIAVSLPFVTAVWQVFVLVVALQIASAAFTPTFQAVIPTVLTEEKDYTRALSLSRLAFDLEGILSPVLAAALLTVMSFSWLFVGTAAGFLGSAMLVLAVSLPRPARTERASGIVDRTTRGVRIHLATPRLRAQLGLNLAAAAAGAMVLVNTVVIVRGDLGLTDTSVALALGLFGGGSALAALLLPRVLDGLPDRVVMTTAALALAALLGCLAAAYVGMPDLRLPVVLAGWLVLGIGYSAVLTPVGRLVRRSGHPGDWPVLFAAQFALSHAGWLLTYLLAGLLGGLVGGGPTMGVLAAVALGGAVYGARVWPRTEPLDLEHVHHDLGDDHPHLRSGRRHAHPYVIDDTHRRWPTDAIADR
ncbi:MFS transporter [Actinokineospora sp.]|uniref:MFS transporter n=1 Tax=Actinokineospora sp. TaxID=1872133 RepID=UPI0040380429